MKIKVRYTQQELLKYENGLTFVAQRPLMGLVTWYQNDGKSIYGRHFAWMPTDSEFKEKWIDYNVKMDARLVKRVTDDEIKRWYREDLKDYFKKDIEACINNSFDWVLFYFLEKNNDKEIEIE